MARVTSIISLPCRQRLVTLPSARTFTSSSSLQDLSPESPDYVQIPRLLQPDQVVRRRPRGVLPVPREVFPADRPEKLNPDFLDGATKTRQQPLDLKTATDVQIYKDRLAERRRSHLKEGLTELRARKLRVDKQTAARERHRRDERARLLTQAEREDERLTESSVLKAMLPRKGRQIPDPQAQERHAASVARVQAQAERKSEERREALHTLYVNAQSFITTEKDLNAEIERVFPDHDDPMFRTPVSQGDNIWNLGAPPTVAEMLKATSPSNDGSSASRRSDLVASQGQGLLTARRIKKIAEELSGGKMG